jgi:hypothetical protein
MPPSTPPGAPKRHEYDILRHTYFFNAFDSKEKHVSVGAIARLPQVNQYTPFHSASLAQTTRKLG